MGKHHNTTKAFTCTAWSTAHTVNVHTAMALPPRQMKMELDNDTGRWKHRWTKTEAAEDGDVQRWRQAISGTEQSGSSLSADDYPRVKQTEADEEDRLTLGSSKAAAPFQLTNTPEWWRWNLIPHFISGLVITRTNSAVLFQGDGCFPQGTEVSVSWWISWGRGEISGGSSWEVYCQKVYD